MNVSGQNFNYCASQTSIEYSITDQPWRADKQTMILAKFGKKTASRILRIFVGLGLNESMPTLTGNIPVLLVKIMRKLALRIIWKKRVRL